MNDFLKKMQDILKDDFDSFLQSVDLPAYRGLRVNTLKCEDQKLISLLPYSLEKTPFCKNGYYIPDDVQHIGLHPLHHAGAFYVQEPSAMSAVTMLDVEKGDKVLDLCAAPGSKTTQIAAELGNTGMLWSNEIVRSRAAILLSNLERCGVRNAVVSSASPEVLCPSLPSFFDKILVDAPCSGEGMFRKDKSAFEHWSVEHSNSCANRQLMILNSAKLSLKVGGVMVYSTCTFSYEENEGVVIEFLKQNPNFELVDSKCDFGRSTLDFAKRIFPMDGGEGQFCAKLVKNSQSDFTSVSIAQKSRQKQKALQFQKADAELLDFISEIFDDKLYSNIYTLGDKSYSLSDEMCELLTSRVDLRALSVIKMGTELALSKGTRYEPCHNAFTSADPNHCKNIVDLSLDDDRLYKYLHGEEIQHSANVKGYTCICVEGIPLGFAKASGNTLKNKYPKGLRNNG